MVQIGTKHTDDIKAKTALKTTGQKDHHTVLFATSGKS